MVRSAEVLGPGRPGTLTIRSNIAFGSAQVQRGSGDEPDQASLAEPGWLADDALAAGDTAVAVSCCEQTAATALLPTAVAALLTCNGTPARRTSPHIRQTDGCVALSTPGHLTPAAALLASI